jgi:hypothetical protein
VVTKSNNRMGPLSPMWKDQSESWIRLADMKEAHPVETAMCAKSRRIDRDAAFAGRVPYTLRKSDVLLASVKQRIRKTTHKYGIEIPSSVEHVYDIDKQSGKSTMGPGCTRRRTLLDPHMKLLSYLRSCSTRLH